MDKKVIIVDGYSSGNLLAPEFKLKGVTCDHVQSTREIWPTLIPSFKPGDFERRFAFDGNLPDLVNWAREGGEPLAVLAGTETGVELADQLSEALELRSSNGTQRSEARRNKYLMIETCRQAGLRVARQIKTQEWAEVVAWLGKTGLRKFVIKPLQSAWTDQVAVCEDLSVGKEAFCAILGSVNKLGIKNEFVLAQEFLEGVEHFVNSVSHGGRHFITDIWRYQKRSLHGHDCVYDADFLLPSEGELETPLHRYVEKVLDALGVRFGPAHAEVMWGPEGPILVEVGSRLDGLLNPSLNREAVGLSMLDLTLDTYLDPKRFLENTQKPYEVKKHARTVYLTSYVSGKIKSIPGEEYLKKLPSFFNMRLRVQTGSELSPTSNFFSTPGVVGLLHQDPAVLERDYQAIREMEKTALFETER